MGFTYEDVQEEKSTWREKETSLELRREENCLPIPAAFVCGVGPGATW